MKKLFLILFASLLAACAPLASRSSSEALASYQSALIISTSVPAGQITPAPTWSYLIPPTPTATDPATPTAIPTETATSLPTPAGPICLTLLAPADGTTFLKRKPVKFTWYAKRGARVYVLLLAHQDGFREKIPVHGTTLSLDQKAGAVDLTYQWSVAAYDADNQLICNSPVRTYTLHSAPVVTPSAGSQVLSP